MLWVQGVCADSDMAVHLGFVLILTGLTGTHTITTVSDVSVPAGASITIPCRYDSQYSNHVKFLCQGTLWLSCSTKVRTDTQGPSGRFSISDDKIESIFTVTMKDLKDKDTHYYWCAVETEGSDVKKLFHLSVSRDTPSLYVRHQEVTGFKGEQIIVTCHNNNFGVAKWCRLDSSCVTWPIGWIDGASVTIRRDFRSTFSVIMSGLKLESSGWYLCVKGDLQMPVHVTVTEKPMMATDATTGGFSTLSPTPDLISDSGEEPAAKDEADQRSPASFDLKSLIIPLSLLIFIVIVVLFIWFILKRRKRSKTQSSATTAAEEEVTYNHVKQKRKTSSQSGEEVTYCNVGHMRKASGQRSCAESDVDVMYSSVVTIRQKAVKRDETKHNEVTYSTLAHHHQKM